jgi:hypothetical protein
LFGATAAYYGDKDRQLSQPSQYGQQAWTILATWLRLIATVVFLGPVLFHSNRFQARSWARISEDMEIPMPFITVAVPLTVGIIFIHLFARLLASDAYQPKQ